MSDVLVLSARCARLSRRNVEAVITALALPVLLMAIFVELFGGAIDTGAGTGDYVTYVAPGVALLCAGFGAAATAVAVSVDLSAGVVDRLRSMDVSGAALLGGHVAASVARNAVATTLVFAVALGLGFEPRAGVWGWLAAIGVLLAFVLALSWLSAAIGLLAGSPEAANGFTFFVMFLPYASSAFVPVDTMPGWLQGFAAHQPVTPVVDTLRALLLDGRVGSAWWQALLWCGGIAAASVAVAAWRFGQR